MTQQTITLLHFVRDHTGLSSRESVQPTICTVHSDVMTAAVFWEYFSSSQHWEWSSAVEVRNLDQSCQDSARCYAQTRPGMNASKKLPASHHTPHWAPTPTLILGVSVAPHSGYQQLFTLSLLIKYVLRNMSALIPNMLVHDAC